MRNDVFERRSKTAAKESVHDLIMYALIETKSRRRLANPLSLSKTV
jgi:hypothetical protein